MQQFESEIIHYTEDIWKSILDLDVKKSEDTFCNQGGESILAGFVQITGSWEGAVALDRPVELAKKVASIMFQLKEDETTADLIEDGLGELTNITGDSTPSRNTDTSHAILGICLSCSGHEIHGFLSHNLQCELLSSPLWELL